MSLPDCIDSVERLDSLLSEPTPGVIDVLSKLPGDLLILGVGGKMGPTLACMAARASQQAGTKRRIIGVARFTNPELPAWLKQHGVEPLTCDRLSNSAPPAAPPIPGPSTAGSRRKSASATKRAASPPSPQEMFIRSRPSPAAAPSKPTPLPPSANTPPAALAANACTTILVAPRARRSRSSA